MDSVNVITLELPENVEANDKMVSVDGTEEGHFFAVPPNGIRELAMLQVNMNRTAELSDEDSEDEGVDVDGLTNEPEESCDARIIKLKVIHSHVDSVISQRSVEYETRRNIKKDKLQDEHGVKRRLAFLDLLLDAKIDGRPLSKDELRDEVNTFMFEGHDTTSSAITFCLLMIATHPEVQRKLIEEQITIFGPKLKTGNPTHKELNEMKYLELVIKETLRLYPSVPFFGRKIVKDLEFKGTLYPQGISIMLFAYGFQRNPAYFPNPDKFLPERFENTSGRLPFMYTPFSAGPRNCIGQKFAMLEMLSTISKVVRNFELTPAKPKHKIQLSAETILISKNGVKISLRDRK